MNSSSSMYSSIALDIAQRIVNGDFKVGAKLSGRSLLASHYNVSPETIRKAVALLKDSNVVSVSQGKEIAVQSVEQAYNFIAHSKDMQSVYSLKQEIELLLEQKTELDRRFEHILTEIINYSDRLKNLTPYNPIEIKIPENSPITNQTILSSHFWERTGATIIAIRRETEIIISPGPNAVLKPFDRVVVVGQEDILEKVSHFIANHLDSEKPLST